MEERQPEVTLTIQDWNRRFSQQAQWSKDIREYVFRKANLEKSAAILEVGCGTGAFLQQTPEYLIKFGIDIAMDRLEYGKKRLQKINLACADANTLPYPGHCFEMTICHYLLLWVHDPLKVLCEMRRVTKSGGIVAAYAEPDYGDASGHPQIGFQIHTLQKLSLIDQGADPLMGRQLHELFDKLDLLNIESGRLMSNPDLMTNKKDIDLEIEVIHNDIQKFLHADDLKKLLHDWRKEIKQNPSHQEIPTFFAFGYVK